MQTKFCTMPGPEPLLLTAKIPRLAATTSAGAQLDAVPPTVTRSDTGPSGAFEGRTALICVAATNSGSAATQFSFWQTSMPVPPRVVCRGNSETPTPAGGPKSRPKTLKIEPRASEPSGNPGAAKLAALTTLR